MHIQFKHQQYQTDAVNAVVNIFNQQIAGQEQEFSLIKENTEQVNIECVNYLTLSLAQILENVRKIQAQNDLDLSSELIKSEACPLNFDIEMETGTGKTYCYIKTIYELNKQYNFNNFIIVVPNIAIREGVLNNLQITADHFYEQYHKNINHFSYSSLNLNNIRQFADNPSYIRVMIINMQAFNNKERNVLHISKDNLQSQTPISVIAQTKPILILDEPQKMAGIKTEDALKDFNPLFVLRYSATLKKSYNKVYQLDALDAFNQKLVKKIIVCGIKPNNLSSLNSYLYVKKIVLNQQKSPQAVIELEQLQKNGVKRVEKVMKVNDNLYEKSQLTCYKNIVIVDIDAEKVSFNNGVTLKPGDIVGNLDENSIREIQIRETVMSHLAKEWELFRHNIKVLSLFFIDQVKKYRDYEAQDNKGIYAQMFEREYQTQVTNFLQQKNNEINELADDIKIAELQKLEQYQAYLSGTITPQNTHNGYFSIDKKSHKLVDSKVPNRGENQGLSNDIEAYNLILKDKERLLNLNEPVRFIFSHSALREGWDNPNIFTICTLKHSDNQTSRHQEVGRGLRLCVNNEGIRQDNYANVHHINELTIIASESYAEFAQGLQQDLMSNLNRPFLANEEFFMGKILIDENGNQKQCDKEMFNLIFSLLFREFKYLDKKGQLTAKYDQDNKENILQDFAEDDELKPYQAHIYHLLSTIHNGNKLPLTNKNGVENNNSLNKNNWENFKELWHKINYKTVYQVKFDSLEFITKVLEKLNYELPRLVQKLSYQLEYAEQKEQILKLKKHENSLFNLTAIKTIENKKLKQQLPSNIKLDLIGKIAEQTNLTRQTIAQILQTIKADVFRLYQINPEQFIVQASKIINENKADIIVQTITYLASNNDKYKDELITEFNNCNKQELHHELITQALQKHIYPYLQCDSKVEKEFAEKIDKHQSDNSPHNFTLKVFAKLPRLFKIPTPFGDYSPDWAILFEQNNSKKLYFIAETKGSVSKNDLRATEVHKIDCGKKFLDALNELEKNNLNFTTTNSYNDLINKVKNLNN